MVCAASAAPARNGCGAWIIAVELNSSTCTTRRWHSASRRLIASSRHAGCRRSIGAGKYRAAPQRGLESECFFPAGTSSLGFFSFPESTGSRRRSTRGLPTIATVGTVPFVQTALVRCTNRARRPNTRFSAPLLSIRAFPRPRPTPQSRSQFGIPQMAQIRVCEPSP